MIGIWMGHGSGMEETLQGRGWDMTRIWMGHDMTGIWMGHERDISGT